MPYNIDNMIKRVKKARSTKTLWESNLRECYRYTIPHKQTFDEFTTGAEKHQYVFDSTAVVGVEKFASRMQSQLVPPWRHWAKLEAGSEIPKDEVERVNKQLEEVTDIIFDHLNHSNFSTQVHECFLDLSISTGVLICEESDSEKSSLNFRSVSLSEVMIERTNQGIVKNVWRELCVPVQDINQIWPKAKLNDVMQKMLQEDPLKEVNLIEGVVYNPDDGSFMSILFSEKHKFQMYEETLETSPWIVFRESVIAGETLGRGRVMTLIHDIKSLNEIVRMNLDNAGLASAGAYTVRNDGVVNPFGIRIEPRSLIPVDSNETGNPTLAPLPMGGNFDLTQLSINDLRDNIRNYLYSQPFGQIDQTPVRSATEMGIRNEDLNATSSSAFGRLQTELLDQLLTRVVSILTKAGKIAPIKVDGKEVTIKFTSPMARRQDIEELESTSTFGQFMQMLPPDIAQKEINYSNVVENLVRTTGVPKNYQYSEEEKAERAEAEAKARAEAIQLAQMEAEQGDKQ